MQPRACQKAMWRYPVIRYHYLLWDHHDKIIVSVITLQSSKILSCNIIIRYLCNVFASDMMSTYRSITLTGFSGLHFFNWSWWQEWSGQTVVKKPTVLPDYLRFSNTVSNNVNFHSTNSISTERVMSSIPLRHAGRTPGYHLRPDCYLNTNFSIKMYGTEMDTNNGRVWVVNLLFTYILWRFVQNLTDHLTAHVPYPIRLPFSVVACS